MRRCRDCGDFLCGGSQGVCYSCRHRIQMGRDRVKFLAEKAERRLGRFREMLRVVSVLGPAWERMRRAQEEAAA